MHTSTVRARLGAARVLIVDDSGVTRKLTGRMLARLGVRTIYEAGDGASGLEKLRTFAPDAVILDWEMPDLHGGKFLRAVRSPDTFPFPDTPIIVVSGHGEETVVTEAFCAGVNEFLVKPMSTHALLQRLVQVLVQPRKMVRIGAYYGPEPRKEASLLQPQSASASGAPLWVV